MSQKATNWHLLNLCVYESYSLRIVGSSEFSLKEPRCSCSIKRTLFFIPEVILYPLFPNTNLHDFTLYTIRPDCISQPGFNFYLLHYERGYIDSHRV